MSRRTRLNMSVSTQLTRARRGIFLSAAFEAEPRNANVVNGQKAADGGND
jgi:hypothetical protein